MGVSAYANDEVLQKSTAWVDTAADAVLVDEEEIAAWARAHPQPYDRTAYQGLYADVHGGPEGAHNAHNPHAGARRVDRGGSPGRSLGDGGAPRQLPRWDDLQILTAQLARRPLLDDAEVGTDVVIGPRVARPLHLRIPIFVTDMSHGALSREARLALAIGAEMRECQTNNCPVGIATQREHLRSRLDVEESAHRLAKYLDATVELMQVLARACGHAHIRDFRPDDLTTWKKDIAELTGVAFAGPDGSP